MPNIFRGFPRESGKTVADHVQARTTPQTGCALGAPPEEGASSCAPWWRASAPFALPRNTRKTVAGVGAPPKELASSCAPWWRASAPFALLSDHAGNTRAKVIGIYLFLIAFNCAAWIWALFAFRHYPVLLGTAFLAYSFGLRHAVDADHIAAIDNVTRKLMQEGRRPVAVGFMFSLGHSTVVFIGAAALAGTALSLHHGMDAVKHLGAIAGTLVSAVFLFGIAIVNLFVLRSISLTFQRVRRGEPYTDEDLDLLLSGRGFLSRFFRPMFALIRKSAHMYPLGVLFGLGFDTATEIGLLGISATEASKGLPFGAVLVFPVLFAAGMSLIDTTDNILMLGAYGWAFVNPVRKLYYNMTITTVSVLIAFVVGGIELLGLLAGQFSFGGRFWTLIEKVNNNFGLLGYFIVALFVVSWAVSALIYKWRRYEQLEYKG